MKANPLNMLTFSPTVDTDTRIAILDAAKWLFDMDMLVPVHVRVSKRLKKSRGFFLPGEGSITISHDVVETGRTEGIQFVAIHELVHAHQYSQDKTPFARGVYVRGGPSTKAFNAYLMQRIEREANWWACEFVKERYNIEANCVAKYRELGATEF